MLAENSGYCSIAESAKREADKLDVKETLSLLRDSVLAAAPCIASVFWTTMCVAGGLYVGFKGLNIVSQEKEEAFDRFLTGKEFETLGSLSDKERELYLEKLFFPLGVWGDTAAMAKALGKSFKGVGRMTRARMRDAAKRIRQDIGTLARDAKKGVDYTIEEIRRLIKMEKSRLLSDYDFLRLSRTPDEQRLIEETIVKLELDGMDQQTISSKVRSAVDQCTVK